MACRERPVFPVTLALTDLRVIPESEVSAVNLVPRATRVTGVTPDLVDRLDIREFRVCRVMMDRGALEELTGAMEPTVLWESRVCLAGQVTVVNQVCRDLSVFAETQAREVSTRRERRVR
uniref:(northern house mosquito) hypothetical protein n=1 Tax=Culex pipiens TaxID=7175 RepID=A0A8D8CYM4_CULPI